MTNRVNSFANWICKDLSEQLTDSEFQLHKYLFVNSLKKTVHTIDRGNSLPKGYENSDNAADMVGKAR